jgi:hypothetical protein
MTEVLLLLAEPGVDVFLAGWVRRQESADRFTALLARHVVLSSRGAVSLPALLVDSSRHRIGLLDPPRVRFPLRLLAATDLARPRRIVWEQLRGMASVPTGRAEPVATATTLRGNPGLRVILPPVFVQLDVPSVDAEQRLADHVLEPLRVKVVEILVVGDLEHGAKLALLHHEMRWLDPNPLGAAHRPPPSPLVSLPTHASVANVME